MDPFQSHRNDFTFPITGPATAEQVASSSSDRLNDSVSTLPPQASPPETPGSGTQPADIPAERIRRPRNAFMIFRSEFKIDKAVEKDHRNISKIVGSVWNSMPDPEKVVWTQRADQEKLEHMRKYPNYKFAPVVKKEKPLRRRGKRDSVAEALRCRRVANLLLEGKQGNELLYIVNEGDQDAEAKSQAKKGPNAFLYNTIYSRSTYPATPSPTDSIGMTSIIQHFPGLSVRGGDSLIPSPPPVPRTFVHYNPQTQTDVLLDNSEARNSPSSAPARLGSFPQPPNQPTHLEMSDIVSQHDSPGELAQKQMYFHNTAPIRSAPLPSSVPGFPPQSLNRSTNARPDMLTRYGFPGTQAQMIGISNESELSPSQWTPNSYDMSNLPHHDSFRAFQQQNGGDFAGRGRNNSFPPAQHADDPPFLGSGQSMTPTVGRSEQREPPSAGPSLVLLITCEDDGKPLPPADQMLLPEDESPTGTETLASIIQSDSSKVAASPQGVHGVTTFYANPPKPPSFADVEGLCEPPSRTAPWAYALATSDSYERTRMDNGFDSSHPDELRCDTLLPGEKDWTGQFFRSDSPATRHYHPYRGPSLSPGGQSSASSSNGSSPTGGGRHPWGAIN